MNEKMDRHYQLKSAKTFAISGFVALLLIFIAPTAGIIVAVFCWAMGFKFYASNTPDKVFDAQFDEKILPKLSEIVGISTWRDKSQIYLLTDEELKLFKKSIRSAKPINSTVAESVRYRVEVKDKWEGLWDIYLIQNENGSFEICKDRRYFTCNDINHMGNVLINKA